MTPASRYRIKPAAAVAVVLGALLLYGLRFGYDYAHSDQDELLPYLLHRLDPTVLAADWFVQTQAAGVGVRTYFVTMLEALAHLMPVWAAVLLVYVAAWSAIAGAVYALGSLLGRDRLVGVLAVVGALVLTPQWTLGGNDLVHRMLVPSMVGWALGLWGLYAFLRHRPLLSGVLLGVATWAQALVGLQLAGIVGVLLLVNLARPKHREQVFVGLPLFVLAFATAAAPMLGLLAVQQLQGSPAAPEGLPSLAYILAAFRAPHHYLPSAFTARSVLRFGLLAAGGLGAFALPAVREHFSRRVELGTMLATIAGVCAFAYVFTEVVPVLFVIKLQLFKLTVLAKVLLLVLLSAAAVRALQPVAGGAITHGLDRPLAYGWVTLVLVLMAWGGAAWSVVEDAGPLRTQIAPLVHPATPLGQVEAWAQTDTPRTAVFAVPPTWSGFRSRAERPVVVTFKAYPFQDAEMWRWFTRLMDVAPVALPERGGTPLLDDLDRAFETLPPDAVRALADRYGVTHIVRQTPLPDSLGFAPLFEAAPWTAYRLAPSPDAAGAPGAMP